MHSPLQNRQFTPTFILATTQAFPHISCPHPFLAHTPVLKLTHCPIPVALRRLQFESPQMINWPQAELHACWSLVTQSAEKEPAGPLEGCQYALVYDARKIVEEDVALAESRGREELDAYPVVWKEPGWLSPM